MLFFGTPHRGLIIDDIKQMVAEGNITNSPSSAEQHPRMRLLQQIEGESDLLKNQLVDFKNLIGDRKIVSFYETLQTKRLQLVGNHLNSWIKDLNS